MSPQSERAKNAVATAIFLAVVAVLLFVGWRLTGSEILIRDCSFDSTAWAEGRDLRRSGDRYAELQPRAEDVEECDLVAGASPDEVRELLGAPDDVRKPRHGRGWSYDLGLAGDLDSDTNYLYVEFGESRRVVLVEAPPG